MVQKQKDFVKVVTNDTKAAECILKEFFSQNKYSELQALQAYINPQQLIAFIHAFSGQTVPVPKIGELVKVAERLGYINDNTNK